MTRLPSLVVLAVAGLPLVGCSDVDLGGVAKDAAREVAVADVTPQVPADAASCTGTNPAARTCRTSADECIPSLCTCGTTGGWMCTADCRTDAPLCHASDAADTGPDAGPDLGPDVAPDLGPDRAPDLGPDGGPLRRKPDPG